MTDLICINIFLDYIQKKIKFTPKHKNLFSFVYRCKVNKFPGQFQIFSQKNFQKNETKQNPDYFPKHSSEIFSNYFLKNISK